MKIKAREVTAKPGEALTPFGDMAAGPEDYPVVGFITKDGVVPCNPECPACPNRCGGVCQMAEPVVCETCGIVGEKGAPMKGAHYVWIDYINAGRRWVRCGDLRPLPEPHDPDLGALHGVGTFWNGWEIVWFGPAGFGPNWGSQIDPTGEKAFLRSVGES